MKTQKNIDVSVIMGSQSDWETMKHSSEILKDFKISHENKIVSAHRTPERLYNFAKLAQKKKSKNNNSWCRRICSFTWNGCINDKFASFRGTYGK